MSNARAGSNFAASRRLSPAAYIMPCCMVLYCPVRFVHKNRRGVVKNKRLRRRASSCKCPARQCVNGYSAYSCDISLYHRCIAQCKPSRISWPRQSMALAAMPAPTLRLTSAANKNILSVIKHSFVAACAKMACKCNNREIFAVMHH